MSPEEQDLVRTLDSRTDAREFKTLTDVWLVCIWAVGACAFIAMLVAVNAGQL